VETGKTASWETPVHKSWPAQSTENPNSERAYCGGSCAKTTQSEGASLHIAAGDFGTVFEKGDKDSIFSISQWIRYGTRR
jgi:methylaspartate ammonia-lyase